MLGTSEASALMRQAWWREHNYQAARAGLNPAAVTDPMGLEISKS